MIRTQIQLSEKQAKALKSLAAGRNVSVAELIRQAVDEALRAAGTFCRARLSMPTTGTLSTAVSIRA